jgi:hypothetical protein
LGFRQEKSPTAQITRTSYRQISTIAGDFIGMMGFPSGRTRICVVPGAGALIRHISVESADGVVFSGACNEISEDLCARCMRAQVHRPESVVIEPMAARAVWSKMTADQMVKAFPLLKERAESRWPKTLDDFFLPRPVFRPFSSDSSPWLQSIISGKARRILLHAGAYAKPLFAQAY